MLSIFGHSWDTHREVSPRIHSANRMVVQNLNKVQCCIHHQWTLDYSITPTGRHRLGAEENPWHQRRSGEAHLHAPGCPYWEDMRQGKNKSIESAFIIFELAPPQLLSWDDGDTGSGNIHADPLQYVRFQDPSGKLGDILIALARLGHERGEEAFWEAQALFCRIIGLLLASRPLGADEREIINDTTAAEEMNFARRVDHFLQQHLTGAVTLEAIARHLHVSPSTLSHRYRAETGQSPMTTLARKRVGLAKLMLVKGHSLKAIAPATGFCDAFHLSKTFKRIEGLSPRRFLADQQSATPG